MVVLQYSHPGIEVFISSFDDGVVFASVFFSGDVIFNSSHDSNRYLRYVVNAVA